MNAERWRQIEEVLHTALDLEDAERAAFLQETRGDDPDLLREVRSLLAALQRDGGFLEGCAVDLVAEWPTDLAQSAEAGQRFGSYQLLRELGHGGMSTVYLAIRADDAYDQRVAVKVIKRGHDTDSVLRRFRSERQILASLEHPNIARIFDGGSAAGGRPYFVMELIEGTRIDDFCDQRRLSVAERLRLVRQVCSAVHYAHQNLVVHRDIKPSNILVTAAGVPKLLDFGIAKLLDPEAFPQTVEMTRTGLRPMTPQYASPEQLQGLRITTASDVYSLGMLLFKLLTGRLPKERTAESAGRSGAAPPRATLTGDLENIVRMALREEPARRYASVEQLSEDLRRYLKGLPVRARRDTLGYRAGKFLRRNKIAVGVAVAFLALVVGFVVAMARQVEKTTGERDRAEVERDKAEQVSELLFDLFESFDPGNARGDTITARELLDLGAEKVEAELEDKPLVQAAAFDTIGRVYEGLGMFDRALPLLERALSQRREVLGGEHLDVAASCASLGALSSTMGDYPRSEALHREAVVIRGKLLGEEHPEVAESLTAMTLALLRQGRYPEAKLHQQEALALQRKLLDGNDPALATSLSNLGHVLFEEGDLPAAEELIREALAIRLESLGPDHPDVATTLHNLASVLLRQGSVEAAESLYREALAIRRKILGEEHPDVASVMHSLGRMLVRKGEHEEAERLLSEALAMRRKLLGENHVDIAKSLSVLASLLRAKGDLEAAARLYRQGLDVGRRLVGPGHPGQAYSLLELGTVLVQLGDGRGAEPVLREAYDIRKRALPAASPLIAMTADALGACLTELGEYGEAEGYLLESHRILKAQEGGRPDALRRSLEQLVALYDAWGKPQKAAEYRVP